MRVWRKQTKPGKINKIKVVAKEYKEWTLHKQNELQQLGILSYQQIFPPGFNPYRDTNHILQLGMSRALQILRTDGTPDGVSYRAPQGASKIAPAFGCNDYS